uniref:Uncharacterized protein n=1 Tax=Acrobeloides nanus TaxID=290746 RepID=A0A914EI40_9BILA
MESAEYVLYDWTNWGDWHGPWGIIGGIFIVSFVFIAVLVWLSLLSKKRMFVERGYTLPQYHTDQKYREDILKPNFQAGHSNPVYNI